MKEHTPIISQINNILSQGQESEEGIDIIISLTSMTSEQMIKALKFHLVRGAGIDACIAAYGVTQSNISRDLKKLNDVARKIDTYFEINYRKSVK